MPATPDVLIRARREGDVPALAQVLADQQPTTRYPLRWPLPFPVEQFLVRATEEQAWVAELAGDPVGHVTVSRVSDPEIAAILEPTVGLTAIASISVLFVADHLRGSGIGGRLLDTAVTSIVRSGRRPVLDVVAGHHPAVEVYRHRGWQEVGRCRPAWLPAEQEPVIVMVWPDRPTQPA